MTQTSNRFLDEMARLMNDAAGVASGVRREVDTVVRNQADRILRDLDVVKREEFEAVKEMARLAREENEDLKARVAALEARLGPGGPPKRLSCPPFLAGPARSAFLVFVPPPAISPPNPRPAHTACSHRPRPDTCGSLHRGAPEECRGEHRPLLAAILFQEDLHHGDRQADEGGGALAGRQGGCPGGASRRPRTGRDLGDGKPPLNVSVDHTELKSASMPGAS